MEPRLQVTYRKVGELIPYVNNARTHSESQIASLAGSIREFNFNQPILIDPQGSVIAGHARLMAARKPGLSEVPTIEIAHLSPAQRKAYILADNRIALEAGWDNDLLKLELDALVGEGIDLGLTGFSEDDLKLLDAALDPVEGLTDPDSVPEPNDEPVSREGDIWILGNHRLMCGDSTSPENVATLMDFKKASLLFTSPPYSDMRDYSGNDVSIGTMVSIFPAYFPHVSYFAINLGLQFKENEVFPYWDAWISKAKETGLKFLSWNVWDKVNAGKISSQRRMFALMHEWVFIFGDEPRELNRTWENSEESKKRYAYYKVNEKGQKLRGVRQKDGSIEQSTIGTLHDNKNMGTVITCDADKDSTIDHPARYPVHFPLPFIEAMTGKGDSVVDPFGGSGTTLIACEKSGRNCMMMEISPVYSDLIVRRWQEFTGKVATLESTGQSFEEVANGRKATV